jgi:hypothetical protein
MLQSKFISDILELLLDADDAQSLPSQSPYLTESEFEYTGNGVFVSFSYAEGIDQYRLETDKLILDGVLIESNEISDGASATLFIKKGLINYLEIWNHAGDYPKKDLSSYHLTQNWQGARASNIPPFQLCYRSAAAFQTTGIYFNALLYKSRSSIISAGL